MSPKNGYGDWEVTQLIANAMGLGWTYSHPSEIMDEVARLTPRFANVSYDKLDKDGSVQWPCNDTSPDGMPIMHVNGFTRGKGKFVITEYVPTDEKTGPRFPLLLTTGRILSQYNVGAQTRRTENSLWHEEDVLEIHPHDAEDRGVRDGDWVRVKSRAGETTLHAKITDRMAPGVVYTTFHHPMTQANVVTTDNSDWATNCPEYKVTAVQVSPSNGPTEWQEQYEELARKSRRIAATVEAAIATNATRVRRHSKNRTASPRRSRIPPMAAARPNASVDRSMSSAGRNSDVSIRMSPRPGSIASKASSTPRVTSTVPAPGNFSTTTSSPEPSGNRASPIKG